MKCPLCGLEFNQEDGLKTCSGCKSMGACGLIKCPNCGYEVPAESGIVKFIKRWRKKTDESK